MLTLFQLQESRHYFQVPPAHRIRQFCLSPMVSTLSTYYRPNHKRFDTYLNPMHFRARLIFGQQE